jgi:hypothetical protein
VVKNPGTITATSAATLPVQPPSRCPIATVTAVMVPDGTMRPMLQSAMRSLRVMMRRRATSSSSSSARMPSPPPKAQPALKNTRKSWIGPSRPRPSSMLVTCSSVLAAARARR